MKVTRYASATELAVLQEQGCWGPDSRFSLESRPNGKWTIPVVIEVPERLLEMEVWQKMDGGECACQVSRPGCSYVSAYCRKVTLVEKDK